MKTHLCLFLTCVSLVTAQDTSKEDPFIKDKKAAAVTQEPGKAPQNVLCMVETITLPQVGYAALLDLPEGHEKLYERAVGAVMAGTAKLDGCHWLRTKSGTRSTVEAVDELIYPTQWGYANSTGFQYPISFEMRQLGDRFEFEPVIDDETGTLNFTHCFQRDRLLGFYPYKADSTLAGVPVVSINGKQAPAGCVMIPSVPTLISTLGDSQSGDITLVFATAHVVNIIETSTADAKGSGNVLMTVRVVSLDRMKGWQLLKKHPLDSGACLAELKPMLAAKEAALEHISTINTRSGTRSVHASGKEYLYGTEFDQPTEATPGQKSEDPKKPDTPARARHEAGTTAFENRPLGFRWEVEPVLNEANTTCDITISPSNTVMRGNLQDPNWNEHYPEIPLFSNQQITVGCTQAVGSTVLLGTLNPPGDTGANEHKDEGRMWLLFLDVNLE